jgi:hypothetical protein
MAKDVASHEVDRYRQAAEHTLQQLDWTINYLYSIHKTEIAHSIANNCSVIRRRMTEEVTSQP